MGFRKTSSSLRFLAFFLDFTIVMVVMNIFWDWKGTQGLYFWLVSSVKNSGLLIDFINGPDIMASFLLIWGYFFLVKILSNFIFSVSLGQLTLGFISKPSGLLSSRIKAVIRGFIEALTSPFLIFDLPCLIGKKTLKEVISKSELQRKSNFFFLKVILGVPFIFGLCFLLLTVNLSLSSPEYASSFKVVSYNGSEIKNPLKLKEVSSPLHRFKVLSSLDKEGIQIIPSFSIQNTIKGKKISPKIIFYDQNYNLNLELNAFQKIKLFDYLVPSLRGNILFGQSYPEFLEAYDEPDKYNPIPIKEYHPDKSLFSRKLKEEVKTILQTAFDLNRGNVLNTILTNGPFINGFQTVKQKVLGLFPKGGKTEIGFVRLGGHVFFKVTKKWNSDRVDHLRIHRYFLPIETNNVQSFKISGIVHKDDLKNIKLMENKLMSSFFGTSNWYFDYEKGEDINIPMEQPDAFSIVNYFMKKELSPDVRQQLEEFTYNLIYKVGGQSLRPNSKIPMEMILQSIKSINYVASVKSRGREKVFSKEFHTLLSTLHNNLQNKNLGFFGVL